MSEYAPPSPRASTGTLTGVVKFTRDDAERASVAWGANCGPAAIAAVVDLTLEDVRPHLGAFDEKRYMNPSMVYAALHALRVQWKATAIGRELRDVVWPLHGLVRIQWEGPWTKPGVPMAARYRYTHWVGARRTAAGVDVFDINALCVGGWIELREWRDELVPWLLKESQPRASGLWHVTHILEVVPRVSPPPAAAARPGPVPCMDAEAPRG